MGRRSRRPRHEAPVSFFAFQDIITAVTGILILVTLVMSLDLTRPQASSSAPVSVDPADAGASPAELAVAAERVMAARATADALASALATHSSPDQRAAGIAGALLAAQTAADASAARQKAETAARRDAHAALNRAAAESKRLADETAVARRDALAASSARQASGDTRLLLPGNGVGKLPILIEARADGLVIGRLEPDGTPRETERATPAEVRAVLARLVFNLRADRAYAVVYFRSDGVAVGQQALQALQAADVDVGWDALGPHKLFADARPNP